MGQVGYNFWLNFKKRNADKIVKRKGEKFELERFNWTTYHNFAKMYKHFGNEMEYAMVAKTLPGSVWMDSNGNTVNNKKGSFSCKVVHTVSHPIIILYIDEIGSDTSQKRDGAVGCWGVVVCMPRWYKTK